jgi:hypothetical protein
LELPTELRNQQDKIKRQKDESSGPASYGILIESGDFDEFVGNAGSIVEGNQGECEI